MILLHRLWYLASHTLFAKGQNQMFGGLKVSRPLIAIFVLAINIWGAQATLLSDFKKKLYLHHDI